MLSGLLLDFYGTLVHEDDELIAAICERVAATSATRASAADVARDWYERFSGVCKSAFGEAFVTQREAARASLVGVLAATGCPLDPHELTAAQFNHWRRPPLFEETRCFLERLRLPVCVVSNIGRSDLDAALEHHRLSFDHIVTSEDVRAYKPRPEPFTAALALLQASPEDVVHVGDSLSSDAAGASASRIPFAWVNRKRRQRPAETELWADVTDLTALAERIERR